MKKPRKAPATSMAGAEEIIPLQVRARSPGLFRYRTRLDVSLFPTDPKTTMTEARYSR
jgi:hypothetical protein